MDLNWSKQLIRSEVARVKCATEEGGGATSVGLTTAIRFCTIYSEKAEMYATSSLGEFETNLRQLNHGPEIYCMEPQNLDLVVECNGSCNGS